MPVDQNLLMKASQLHQQSEEFDNQMSFINQQILELNEFAKTLNALLASEEKEMLSSVGKGVYLKTSLISKELFVEVGSGVVVKKTPQQTLEVIKQQIEKFNEMKSQIQSQNELILRELRDAMQTLDRQDKS